VSKRISRRHFIGGAAVTSAAVAARVASPQDRSAPRSSESLLTNPGEGSWARWLDGKAPSVATGVTWGMPWPRGKHPARARFVLRDTAGSAVPLQSWPLAYWPDGSLKWTGHALPADAPPGDGPFEVVPQRAPAAPITALTLRETSSEVEIDTGVIVCRLSRSGTNLISSIRRGALELLRNGRLVLLRQDHATSEADALITREAFESGIEGLTIEQRGPVRAVVRIDGRHANASARRWLPFTVRLYFYAGGEAVRVLHTITFDGDESRDFICGLGLRCLTPLRDALHDRHVRFAGDNDGVFAEAVRGLTGLRRDPGAAARSAQIAGHAVPSIAPGASRHLDLIPAFGDWTLHQASADSFVIRKRTKQGYGWLDADRGRRAPGLAYIGGPTGGVACGIRNCWQSHPAQLDIRHAAGDAAEVTLWVWAPASSPMDLRFYHDGMGQETYERQLEGLELTYEDYEPGFGTPLGVARTSELMLWMLPSTPERGRFAELADALREPAVMVATPHTLHSAEVFGRTFAPPARTTARQTQIEDHLDWLFDFYRRQQDERSWYGFWNYGDVMHTYDADRHVWRYDVGGYAWDNSELSTDIWLWLHFLRSGRPDVFRFAEAMTRHTGEVDVHHLGRFAPLGSRHNVMHWGCSAKQLRISTAVNRRYYYYLTADERVGDLMREQVEAARALRMIQPGRKLPEARSRAALDPDGDHAWLGFGTDWGSVAGAWLTEWERTGDSRWRNRLLASMRTIAAQPEGFFTGGGRMNLRTGAFDVAADPRISVSHLSAVFGLVEVCAELIQLLRVPEFERAWLQYCELYNAPADQQVKALGARLGPLNLQQGHARLTAYAAHRRHDPALVRRAWQEFEAGRAGFPPDQRFEARRVEGSAVLNPVEEAAWVSTNESAQWGLAAIECLAFAPESLGGAEY
jgi:exo-rhamnogalacturonan lyase-like protein